MTNNEEAADLSEDEIAANISNFTSEKLADIIVMHQYLKLYPTVSVSAMNELVERRKKGDEFDYETYISTNLDKLPKVTIPMNNVTDLIQKMIKIL